MWLSIVRLRNGWLHWSAPRCAHPRCARRLCGQALPSWLTPPSCRTVKGQGRRSCSRPTALPPPRRPASACQTGEGRTARSRTEGRPTTRTARRDSGVIVEGMLQKALDDVTEADLVALVTRQEEESYRLEF